MATTRTVQNLIDAALRVLQIVPLADTPTSADRTNGLTVLQDLLAEWSDAGLLVPFTTWESITLVVDQDTYTVGENGSPSLNTVRPEKIDDAFFRDSSSYDYEVTVLGEDAYRAIIAKGSSSSRPQYLWYNPTVPNGTVYVHPAPDTTDSLYICGIKPFTEPSTLDDDILNTTGIPRNYYNMVKWNLAMELASYFQMGPSQMIVARARETMAKVERLNASRRVQPTPLETPGLFGTGDYCVLID